MQMVKNKTVGTTVTHVWVKALSSELIQDKGRVGKSSGSLNGILVNRIVKKVMTEVEMYKTKHRDKYLL